MKSGLSCWFCKNSFDENGFFVEVCVKDANLYYCCCSECTEEYKCIFGWSDEKLYDWLDFKYLLDELMFDEDSTE